MELRIRPKTDYLHQAGWQELYVLTKHWRSDMEFYSDELRFMCNLVDKYFKWLIKDENIGLVQTLTTKLIETDSRQKEIIEKIDMHLSHLDELIENSFLRDSQQFRDEHAILEDRMTAFITAFRKTKKEVFAITEQVMKTGKLQHLLTK